MVGGIIALVVGLATVVVATMVILLVTGTLSGYSAGINYYSGVNSTAGNNTAASLFSNTFSAISLMTILPIIMVAGVIIAAVGGFLMWYRGKG
jgi:hypothetical protein